MRVVIAGSRHISDAALIQKAVDESGFQVTTVICGEADGVDTLGKEWAVANSIPIISFVPDWTDLKAYPCVTRYRSDGTAYNAAAGMIRNRKMAQNADAVIVIWDGKSRGSANMIQEAKKHKIPCYVMEIR